jgi:hypothetical protein
MSNFLHSGDMRALDPAPAAYATFGRRRTPLCQLGGIMRGRGAQRGE